MPVDGEAPRPPDECLRPTVEESVAALELGYSDQGAAALARRYAETIDKAPDQAWAPAAASC
jgi:hypothetical protein